jgi:hypothetical protein
MVNISMQLVSKKNPSFCVARILYDLYKNNYSKQNPRLQNGRRMSSLFALNEMPEKPSLFHNLLYVFINVAIVVFKKKSQLFLSWDSIIKNIFYLIFSTIRPN